jgi:hypothetical protein
MFHLFHCPNSFEVGAACLLLLFSSISCLSSLTSITHILSHTVNPSFLSSTSPSPFLHIHGRHSSSHMLFLSPHHMSMPARKIGLNFSVNGTSFMYSLIISLLLSPLRVTGFLSKLKRVYSLEVGTFLSHTLFSHVKLKI